MLSSSEPSGTGAETRPMIRFRQPDAVPPPDGSDRWADSHSIDVPFAVPFVHRLRFTDDVFGKDRDVLAGVLEPSEGRPAKVQFWLDSNLASDHSQLSRRIASFCEAYSDRVSVAGEPQIIPGGEEVKNDPAIVERLVAAFHAARLDRRSYVVVAGGGAVLDAVGFAAGIAHRGIRLVRLPTTTLAQADSGLGVKNGVNRFQTKNWLGAFVPPWAVINDSHLLQTLSDRDFRAGFSEAVKVSLLKDRPFFEDLLRSASEIARRDMPVCLRMIRRAAQLHLEHITHGGDPFEMLEARPLDFGHWSAHRLETMSKFTLRHGEAVAIGIAIDTAYSALALGLPSADLARVLVCLSELGFTLDHPQLDDFDQLWAGLEEFRQHLGGRLTVTMLQGVGRPLDVHEIDRRLLQWAIRRVRMLTPHQ